MPHATAPPSISNESHQYIVCPNRGTQWPQTGDIDMHHGVVPPSISHHHTARSISTGGQPRQTI